MTRKLQSILGMCFLFSLPGCAPAMAGTLDTAEYYLVWDSFENGISVEGPEAKWYYFAAGSYVGDDGIATTRPGGGLRVTPKGTNPKTGKPAFVRTIGQEDENGGILGAVDHAKWLVYVNHTASSGFKGFDAVPGYELACETWISGQTFGTEFHPFGKAVTNHNDDLRLASFALNTADYETGLIFDFFFTNEQVYAFYERLPFARTPGDRYAGFSHMIPVARRNPDSRHHVKIAYDRAAGVVRWVLDGQEVFRLDQLGRVRREYLSIDHGGVETVPELRQLTCGMGTFTLLDGYLPSKVGLVRLSSAPDTYFFPPLGEPTPMVFLDEESKASSRLFGQGAVMEVERFVVSSTPVTSAAKGTQAR